MDGFFGYADLTDDTSGGGFGGDRVPIVVTYNANTRLYDCVYTPRKSGVYSLSVFNTTLHISGTESCLDAARTSMSLEQFPSAVRLTF